MGGAYISCGSFYGDDKSGSPIQAVLEDVAAESSPAERTIIARIQRLFDDAIDHILIEADEARVATPLIERYRKRIQERIAPITDPFEQIELDHREDPDLDATDAKYGKSVGWKYYCVLDLGRALATSAKEGEPVLISWD